MHWAVGFQGCTHGSIGPLETSDGRIHLSNVGHFHKLKIRYFIEIAFRDLAGFILAAVVDNNDINIEARLGNPIRKNSEGGR